MKMVILKKAEDGMEFEMGAIPWIVVMVLLVGVGIADLKGWISIDDRRFGRGRKVISPARSAQGADDPWWDDAERKASSGMRYEDGFDATGHPYGTERDGFR